MSAKVFSTHDDIAEFRVVRTEVFDEAEAGWFLRSEKLTAINNKGDSESSETWLHNTSSAGVCETVV